MKRIPRLNKVLLLLYFHPEYRQSGLERRPSFKIPTENSERVRSSHKRLFPGYLDFLQEPYTVLGNFFLGAEDRISLIMSSNAASARLLYCTRFQFPGCYGSTGFPVATRFVLRRLSAAQCHN